MGDRETSPNDRGLAAHPTPPVPPPHQEPFSSCPSGRPVSGRPGVECWPTVRAPHAVEAPGRSGCPPNALGTVRDPLCSQRCPSHSSNELGVARQVQSPLHPRQRTGLGRGRDPASFTGEAGAPRPHPACPLPRSHHRDPGLGVTHCPPATLPGSGLRRDRAPEGAGRRRGRGARGAGHQRRGGAPEGRGTRGRGGDSPPGTPNRMLGNPAPTEEVRNGASSGGKPELPRAPGQAEGPHAPTQPLTLQSSGTCRQAHTPRGHPPRAAAGEGCSSEATPTPGRHSSPSRSFPWRWGPCPQRSVPGASVTQPEAGTGPAAPQRGPGRENTTYQPRAAGERPLRSSDEEGPQPSASEGRGLQEGEAGGGRAGTGTPGHSADGGWETLGHALALREPGQAGGRAHPHPPH